MDQSSKSDIVELTAEIVSAYVAKNSLPAGDLPAFVKNVHEALSRITTGQGGEEEKVEELKPAVPIRKSITDDYIISLENGQKFKSLKRHLMTTYKMTPADYRAKWGLPKDYPMVAPGYAASRSALAKSLGLGRKAGVAEPAEAEAAPAEVAPAEVAKKAGRPKRSTAPVAEAAE